MKLVYNNFRTDEMFVSNASESYSSDDDDDEDEYISPNYQTKFNDEDPTSNLINFSNSKGDLFGHFSQILLQFCDNKQLLQYM